jgi:hypothetical protein
MRAVNRRAFEGGFSIGELRRMPAFDSFKFCLSTDASTLSMAIRARLTLTDIVQ